MAQQILTEFEPPLEALRAFHERRPFSPTQVAANKSVQDLSAGYARHYWKRSGLYLRRTSTSIEREDLTAVSMMAAVSAFLGYDPSRGVPLLRYLTFQMFQACREEERRSTSRMAPMPYSDVELFAEEQEDDGDPWDLEGQHDRILAQEAISRLDPWQQRLLYMCHIEGRCYSEIALVMNAYTPVDKSTVMRYHREAINQARANIGLRPIDHTTPGNVRPNGLYRPRALR